MQAPRVAHPVMVHRWTDLTFLHWRYPPEVVTSLLPDGLAAETFDGSAWVGLVPFVMHVDAPVPMRFPETNVRTYVRDPSGRAATWFFSLDAGSLPAVAGGRAGFGLSYFLSRMAVRGEGAHRSYRSVRRFTGARADAEVTLGEPMEPGELDRFLTSRFRLVSRVAGRFAAADVEHPPWPLHHATLTKLDETVTLAAGLPAPVGPPLVHATRGVPVRIGMWRTI